MPVALRLAAPGENARLGGPPRGLSRSTQPHWARPCPPRTRAEAGIATHCLRHRNGGREACRLPSRQLIPVCAYAPRASAARDRRHVARTTSRRGRAPCPPSRFSPPRQRLPALLDRFVWILVRCQLERCRTHGLEMLLLNRECPANELRDITVPRPLTQLPADFPVTNLAGLGHG
jgi:hypothetical protein